MPVPYLHFTDTCRAAMTFYQEVLGGTLEMMGFDQMPDAPDAFQSSDRVMHATLTTQQGPLFASDSFPGETAEAQAGISISWSATDHANGQRIYDQLIVGGQEIMAYGETFFSPGFGMLRDKFGTHWMIMVPAEMG